jgi:hypothetical protein
VRHSAIARFCAFAGPLVFGLLLGASEASAAHVCTASVTPVTLDIGSNSVGAINGGGAPAVSASAGLSCTSGLIAILTANSVTATVSSANNFLLKLAGQAGGVTYTLAAGPNGATPITQGATVQYYSTTLLGLLGLSLTGPFTLPIYAQATASTALPVGTYTDTLTITWHWNICTLGVAVCLGNDTDPVTPLTTSTVKLQIEVAPKPMTISISSLLQSDPIDSASVPKSIPGAITKYTMSVKNNDTVAVNSGTVALNAPTPSNSYFVVTSPLQTVATKITLVDGSPASGLTLDYTSPSSPGTGVTFSSDGGSSWGYAPVANGRGVDPLVTNVMIKPQGAMAAGGVANLNLFYMVR